MEKLLLVAPVVELKQAALDYKQEHSDHGETALHGGALLDQMSDYDT